MTPKIILARAGSRFLIAMALSMGMVGVLVALVLESHRLEAIGEAGWAVFGAGLYALGQALFVVVRAIAQNPSDRTKITEEE